MGRFVLVTLLLTASPALADLDDLGGGSSARCDGCLIATAVVVGVVDVAFLAVGIPTLVAGDAFSPGWAIVEGLWGVGHVIVGGILTPLGILSYALGQPDGGLLAGGILVLGVGIWLVVHAIINLVRRATRDRLPPPRAGLERLVPTISASVDPRGGAGVGLAWAF